MKEHEKIHSVRLLACVESQAGQRRTTACSRFSENSLCGSLARLLGRRVGVPHCAILESNAGTVSWFLRRPLGSGWAMCPRWEASIRILGGKSSCFDLCDDLDILDRRGCHVVWKWTMHECMRLKEGVWSTVGWILIFDDAT